MELTPSERRVLGLSARGLSTREVADATDCPAELVRGVLASAIARLGARSKLEAVIIALRRGLIDIGGDPMPEPWEPTYEARSGDEQLDRLMALAFGAGSMIAVKEELRQPILVCRTEDDALQVYHLITTGEDGAPSPHEMAYVAIYAARATHVAYCFEAWQYDAKATEEMKADYAAGRRVRQPEGAVRPSEHPDRYDVLMLVGERRGEPQVVRRWRIRPGPEGTRVLDELPTEGYQHLPSNINPLFRPPREIRDLIRRHASLARWRDQTRSRRN